MGSTTFPHRNASDDRVAVLKRENEQLKKEIEKLRKEVERFKNRIVALGG